MVFFRNYRKILEYFRIHVYKEFYVNFVGISEKCSYKKSFKKFFKKLEDYIKILKNLKIYIEILKNYIKNFLRKNFF